MNNIKEMIGYLEDHMKGILKIAKETPNAEQALLLSGQAMIMKSLTILLKDMDTSGD